MPLNEFKNLAQSDLPPINTNVVLWNGSHDDPNFCIATLKIDMTEDPPEHYWDSWNDQQYAIHEWAYFARLELPRAS